MTNESYKYLYESIKDKFNFLSNADNAFDTKIGVLIATVIAILAIYFTNVNFQILESWKMKQAVVAIILTFASLLMLLWVQCPKKYRTLIGDEKIIGEYLNKSENDLLLQLISDAQFAFEENKKILDTKVKYYRYSLLLLIISLPLLLLSLLPTLMITI